MLGELTPAVEERSLVRPAAPDLEAVGDWSTVIADQSPEDVPGPEKPAYFFFLAAFFLVAFFFAARFFAIPNHLLECFVPCDEIAFAHRDTGGGRA